MGPRGDLCIIGETRGISVECIGLRTTGTFRICGIYVGGGGGERICSGSGICRNYVDFVRTAICGSYGANGRYMLSYGHFHLL